MLAKSSGAATRTDAASKEGVALHTAADRRATIHFAIRSIAPLTPLRDNAAADARAPRGRDAGGISPSPPARPYAGRFPRSSGPESRRGIRFRKAPPAVSSTPSAECRFVRRAQTDP